jgi:hypothetical protein
MNIAHAARRGQGTDERRGDQRVPLSQEGEILRGEGRRRCDLGMTADAPVSIKRPHGAMRIIYGRRFMVVRSIVILEPAPHLNPVIEARIQLTLLWRPVHSPGAGA